MTTRTTPTFTLEQMLAMIEGLARLNDGHITIYRFTSHWKVQLGTPDLHAGGDYVVVANLKAYDSLPDAIFALGGAALLPEWYDVMGDLPEEMLTIKPPCD